MDQEWCVFSGCLATVVKTCHSCDSEQMRLRVMMSDLSEMFEPLFPP